MEEISSKNVVAKWAADTLVVTENIRDEAIRFDVERVLNTMRAAHVKIGHFAQCCRHNNNLIALEVNSDEEFTSTALDRASDQSTKN
jgi:predicted component of type VI protein secretion system